MPGPQGYEPCPGYGHYRPSLADSGGSGGAPRGDAQRHGPALCGRLSGGQALSAGSAARRSGLTLARLRAILQHKRIGRDDEHDRRGRLSPQCGHDYL
ncbi:protein of unknown function [Acidithiobacillus ferrivorans]|uniref:Uncharacterized protein n=1 Tax=Acidithiobacillus ferrivorans TaxID=160808 RepID=A0ABY1MV40_9PROT|nr:protein of unknown function [Acidithiobacillus ferrivorans]